MAGKLSFQLEILGIEKITNGLKAITRELDNIARKSKNLFTGGNILNVGPTGRQNININTIPAGLTAAAAGAIAANGFKNGNGNGNGGLPSGASGYQFSKVGMGSFPGKGLQQAAIAAGMFNPVRKFLEFNEFLNQMLAKFQKSLGGRIEAVGGFFGKLVGGAAGKHIKDFSDQLAKGKLGVTGLIAVVLLLKVSFEALINAAKRGAEAFQEAARVGHSIRDTSQLRFAMQAIGISGEATSHMLLEAERNRTQRQFGVPGTNMMVAAARVSGFGNVQQLANMSKEFEIAMRASAANARQMERSSGLNLLTSMLWNGLVREFQTMLSQLAAVISPLTDGIIALIKIILKGVNALLEGIIKLYSLLGLKGFPPPTQERIGSLNNVLPKPNAWANIGFVMQGGKSTEYLREIAKNTREAADRLKEKKNPMSDTPPVGGYWQPGIPMMP